MKVCSHCYRPFEAEWFDKCRQCDDYSYPACLPRHGRWHELLRGVDRLFRSVLGIHARFGLQAEPDMSQYVMRNRLALLLEELGEHTAALNRDMEERAVKKLVDMLYVTLGTLELVDENLVGSAFSAVADKNNAKTEETHRYHPDSGKLVRIVVDEE